MAQSKFPSRLLCPCMHTFRLYTIYPIVARAWLSGFSLIGRVRAQAKVSCIQRYLAYSQFCQSSEMYCSSVSCVLNIKHYPNCIIGFGHNLFFMANVSNDLDVRRTHTNLMFDNIRLLTLSGKLWSIITMTLAPYYFVFLLINCTVVQINKLLFYFCFILFSLIFCLI